MLKSSPMLGSVYSHVKELLRNTPSKYKTINREGKRHRGGIGIRERGGENIRERCTWGILWDFRLENPQGGDRLYILKVHCAWTMFGSQQRTNMETNKGTDWLGAIGSVTTKPCGKRMAIRWSTTWSGNKKRKETCLVGWTSRVQAHGKGWKIRINRDVTGRDKGMWVKEWKKRKNKEKCVNVAIVPDSLVTHPYLP